MTPQPSKPKFPPPEAPGAGSSLENWLSWLESIHPAEIDLGLDRVLLVYRRLFRNAPGARVVTVAGTNGKGSTVAVLESLLLVSGRRVGAYTSPHLQNYNERIRIDGRDVDDATLIAAFEKVEAARGSVTLTYFEFGTLAAFVVLADSDVQDWILEVGLGGRLDAVNVVDPDLAIITSVDIDHVAFLGDDREVIGFEKAGILRVGIPAIVADTNPPVSVIQQAAAQKVNLALLGREFKLEESPAKTGNSITTLHVEGQAIRLPAGPLPLHSVAAAVMASRILAPHMPADTIENALADVSVPGRFERLERHPDLYVDVGHNPHAARWLASKLAVLKGKGRKVHAVYAALADKDTAGVAREMASVVDCWHLAGLDVHRGLDPEALRARLAPCALQQVQAHGSVQGAINEARQLAAADDVIIVFGSFFTVAEARSLLVGAG